MSIGRIYVQPHASRGRRERGRKRRGLHPQLEVLLVREHGGLEHHFERLAGARSSTVGIEVLDGQLFAPRVALSRNATLPSRSAA